MAVISPFAGRIYDKVGMRILLVTGAVCMLFSNLAMAWVGMDTPLWAAAVFNSVRCVSIGCLMMPMVTWGTSVIRSGEIAHATALLTSLRTISGAIGSALFVAVMTAVSSRSVQTLGENAPIHGMNVTFLCMAVASGILLFIALSGCSSRSERKR